MATFLHRSTDVHPPSSQNDTTTPNPPASRASAVGILSPLRRTQASHPSLRRAKTVTQPGIAKRLDHPLPSRRKKGPSPSLGHAKRSTETLHQRAMTHDGIPGPREGNHFTVANVGNNGKLYLRPRIESRHHGQPVSVPPSSQTRSRLPPPKPVAASDTRQSIWSSSQFSELRPRYAREDAVETGVDAGNPEPRLRRARSFSTISEYEPSAPGENGQELRIVIDRYDSSESNDAPDTPSFPTLEVPIPHYRLGTPQFNPRGSPVLRSSLHTDTSVSDNTPLPSFLKENEVPTRIPSTYDSPGLSPPVATLSVAMSLFSGVSPAQAKSRYSSSSRRSGIYDLRYPIEPSVFDYLTEDMNDPSVVKYIADGRDISAATPARIVAEISSDTFMDYELVSDFFLTFRPYLSPTHLLALLLARLEWAINRLQDDGRIIRIRTFAALRHWILNYFADDFVANRNLRVQFCDKINSMYADVTARRTAGISDIKILVDLKRCWHGRCLIYWDCEPFTSPDTPVIPGGVPGSRDLRKTRLSEASAPYPDAVIDPEIDSPLPEVGMAKAPQENIPQHNSPQKAHMRNASSGTSRSVPGSGSDNSVQPMSCSFPTRRISASLDCVNNRHPVVVPSQPTTSPSNPRSPAGSSTRRTAMHAHKRSGSFSDSIRDDRAPLSRPVVGNQNKTLLSACQNGSLIRGNLLPPGEATVETRAPPSPTVPQYTDELAESHTRSASDGNIKPLGASPGLKTVIGSIRRALHSRPLGLNTTAVNGPVNTRFSKGKTAALPVNLAFKSDFYKDRRALPGSKEPAKVDYFCQQSIREYREALGLDAPKPPAPFPIGPFKSEGGVPQLQVPTPARQRLGSEVTMGSKSILIVDDTGLDIPVASGGLGWPAEQDGSSRLRESSLTRRNDSSSQVSEVPAAFISAEGPGDNSRFTTQPLDSPVQRFLDTPSVRKTDSIASRLRKYASFHSGASRSTRGGSSDTTGSEAGDEKPLARMLRRRPGGNLRKIQNIHDLNHHPRPQSFATDTSLTDSVASSARHYIRRTFARSSQARALSTPPQFDLVNTDSSQHLRPSFEAAIAEFSRIPDDTDGGVESTLLKLEGKWPVADGSRSRPGEDHFPQATRQDNTGGQDLTHAAFRETGNTSDDYQPTPRNNPVAENRHLHSQVYTDSLVSEFSDSSIPLLERGLSDDSMKKPQPAHQFDAPRPLDIRKASYELTRRESSHRSFQIIDDTESLRQLSKEQGTSQGPSSDRPTRDYGSDLSSEVSVELIDKEEAMHKSNSAGYSLRSASLDIPSHPLAHPPSPPMTIQQTSMPPYQKPETPVVSQAPLTPGPSPTRRTEPASSGPYSREKFNTHPGLISSRIRLPHATDHTPFVLAYSSQVLAQQFTVVEKSALDEVDWKDLVEMKWNHNSSTSVSWVRFLAEQERKGIDLVVGRFNLMVKWILSEIVLTQDIQDRARTISKFIHIAAHARRICNYSTMLQIAIALSSVDCTRLQSTWALVSPADRQLIESIEALIQPVRNFHELRVEMETANLQNGCIPFVGLYVHDLTYNAQKPSQISGTPDGDPLINFERYRTAARIVKCLLRLIDASDKYHLEPLPGLVEKCLWISSLSEEQIQALSKNIG